MITFQFSDKFSILKKNSRPSSKNIRKIIKILPHLFSARHGRNFGSRHHKTCWYLFNNLTGWQYQALQVSKLPNVRPNDQRYGWCYVCKIYLPFKVKFYNSFWIYCNKICKSQKFVTGDSDGKIKLWDIEKSAVISTFDKHQSQLVFYVRFLI